MRIKIATSDNNLETAARFYISTFWCHKLLFTWKLSGQPESFGIFFFWENFSVGDKGVAPKRNRNLRRENNEPEFLLETLNCFLCLEFAFFPATSGRSYFGWLYTGHQTTRPKELCALPCGLFRRVETSRDKMGNYLKPKSIQGSKRSV